MEDRLNVIIAGGGVAGLEAVLALQDLAAERVAITLVTPERHFTQRALSVTEPFRSKRPDRLPLAAFASERGIALRRDAVARVDPDARVVHTQDGALVAYDVLVLALGARPTEAVPGAVTFRGSRDTERVAAVIEVLRDGRRRSAAFVVPQGASWALPLYELALQTARAVPRAELHVVTAEPAPLAAFGDAASADVARLLTERQLRLHVATPVEHYSEGRLWTAGGWTLAVDAVIALPLLVGPHVRGLPADPLGFLPVDEFTRVLDATRVHAVGDVAAHGLKQGGLAAQQADVAAQMIAAEAGADVVPAPYRPALRAMLLTGRGVRYLQRDPDGTCDVSGEPLWWPHSKVAGRHLAPYLATRALAHA